MKYFKSLACVLILLFSFVFQVCDVFGQVRRVKYHLVEAQNGATTKSNFFGATKKHRFGDINVQTSYTIRDETNGSRVQSQVFSSVSMQALTHDFMGFASIRGTADAGHTKQFAADQKKAVKTDKGVLDSAKHRDTGKYTVSTSLVNKGGRPLSLGKSEFTAYEKWYPQASPELRKKWGDSESFSYSGNSFYTAMKYHSVHFGRGTDLILLTVNEKPARDLDLNNNAELIKQKQGNPTDAQLIGMFSPYAEASGKAFNPSGNPIEDTVPFISVSTDDPATNKKKADAGAYNYGLLLAVNDTYTEVGGDTHEAVFYLSNSGTVKWYIKAPGETGNGTLIETDTDTDEAHFSYTFEENASGYYDITAVVEPASGPGYQDSYSIYVTPKGTTSPAISSTLASSDGVYTALAGYGHEANLSTGSPYSKVYWYVKTPSESGYGTNVSTEYGDGSKTTSQLSYSFPSGVSGNYVITAYTYFTGSIIEPSYTVSVSLPSSTTTTTTTEAPAAPSAPSTFSPIFTVYSPSTLYSAGDTLYANVSVSGSTSIASGDLYVWMPGSSSDAYISNPFWGGVGQNSVPVSFTFPENASPGEWIFQIVAYPWSSALSSVTSQSYTVTVQ